MPDIDQAAKQFMLDQAAQSFWEKQPEDKGVLPKMWDAANTNPLGTPLTDLYNEGVGVIKGTVGKTWEEAKRNLPWVRENIAPAVDRASEYAYEIGKKVPEMADALVTPANAAIAATAAAAPALVPAIGAAFAAPAAWNLIKKANPLSFKDGSLSIVKPELMEHTEPKDVAENLGEAAQVGLPFLHARGPATPKSQVELQRQSVEAAKDQYKQLVDEAKGKSERVMEEDRAAKQLRDASPAKPPDIMEPEPASPYPIQPQASSSRVNVVASPMEMSDRPQQQLPSAMPEPVPMRTADRPVVKPASEVTAAFTPDTANPDASIAALQESYGALPRGPLTTPAAESAAIIEQKLAGREAQAAHQNQAERRASIMPPEEGPSEYMQRLEDYKERSAQQVASKPYGQLDEGDRRVVDELALEAMQHRANQRGSFSTRDLRGKPENPEWADLYINRDRIEVSKPEEGLLVMRLNDMHKQGLISPEREKWSSLDEAKQEGVERSLFDQILAGKHPGGIQGRAALEIFRERANELGKELIEDTIKLERDSGTMTTDEIAKAQQEISRKSSDFQNYHGALTGVTTDIARSLAALRRTAGNTTDPIYWVGEAKRSMGLPPGATLPDATLKKVMDLTGAAQQAKASGNAPAAEAAQQNLVSTVAGLRENGWLETAVALWRAGLLTGAKTHLRNVGGNIMFGGMEEASRIPAWAIDVARAGIGRAAGIETERKVWAPSTEAMWKSGIAAATDGIREAGLVLRGKGASGDTAKAEMHRGWNFQGATPPINDLVNKYINLVGRTLGAEDKVFKVYSIRRALEGEARIQAINEARAAGKNDMWMRGRQLELAKNPTDSMAANAIAYADFATFNNTNIAANAIEKGMGHLGPIGRAVVNTNLPFRNTPFNIFDRMVDYSPIGPALAPVRDFYTSKWQKKATPDMIKSVENAVGRGMIGSALMYMGYTYAKQNMATGTAKEDPGKSNVRRAAGRQPGALRLPFAPDDWQKTAAFAPGMTLVQIGADAARQESRSERTGKVGPGDKALDTLNVAKRAFLEQPMMQGIKEVNDIMTSDSDKKMHSFASSRAASMIPQFVADTATAIDPTPKEFAPGANATYPEAIGHGVKARLPWAKSGEPTSVDIFGQPMEGRRMNAVNPFMPTTAKETTDPVIAELIQNDVGITWPKQGKEESDAEYRARKRIVGQVLREHLERGIESLPEDPDERKKALEKIVREAHAAAKKTIEEEYQ